MEASLRVHAAGSELRGGHHRQRLLAGGAVISKHAGADLLGEFFPLEKVESLAVTKRGDVWAAVDNDGGEIESRLVRIRRGH
jgi:hypothetical protein